MGDALLAAAFVSYAGPFTIPFRQALVTERWLPDLVSISSLPCCSSMPMRLISYRLTWGSGTARWLEPGLPDRCMIHSRSQALSEPRLPRACT